MGIYSIVFDKDTREFSEHGGADARNALYVCIGNGNVEQIEAVYGEFENTLLKLIQDDLKYYKLTIQYVLAQLELVAVRGGLSLIRCNELEDRYYRALNEASTPREAVSLLKDHCNELTKMIAACRDYSGMTRECCSYIQNHLYEELSISSIAAELKYSGSYLSHKFKEDIGTTINDYIRSERIAQARKLLRENYTVAEVASMLHFSSQSHFTAAFRKQTGVTPTEYRKAHDGPQDEKAGF